MTRWRRVRSATEWGFFFGVVTWILASGITNKIPTAGVWGILISRALIGLLAGLVKWDFPWWARGPIWGTAVGILSLLVVRLPLGEGMHHFLFSIEHWFWLMLITGMLIGFIIEWVLRHRELQLDSAK
jgi:hypothetical protein